MTPRERVHRALEGRPVDRPPVTVMYSHLYREDHFAELTGRPAWQLFEWLHAIPDDYVRTLAEMVEKAPFEIVQPHMAPPVEVRGRYEFLEIDGVPHRRDRTTREVVSLASRSGFPWDSTANQERLVFSEADIDVYARVSPTWEMVASGANDFVDAAVEHFGGEYFILSGGVTGTIWSSHSYVGHLNVYLMMVDEPDLLSKLCERLLTQNLRWIRALAAAGGDAIYVDESGATSDMISVAQYERFGLPHTTAMVREIQSLGQKAILYYFGGVMDRLEQIASIGADGVLVECSMKGYVNDIAEIVRRIGDRVTVFGNIDPIWVLERGSDEVLEAEVARQLEAGRHGRGFILSCGSPVTPGTPLERVHRYIELGRGA